MSTAEKRRVRIFESQEFYIFDFQPPVKPGRIRAALPPDIHLDYEPIVTRKNTVTILGRRSIGSSGHDRSTDALSLAATIAFHCDYTPETKVRQLPSDWLTKIDKFVEQQRLINAQS